MTWQVPLSDIDLGDEDLRRVESVLRSKWLSMGTISQEFEKAFASFLGVKHAFAVTNATAALHLANMALGIGPDDEVILPSLTFVATGNALLYTGARPVFAEVEGPENLNISPDDIVRRITSRTRAITVVHYAGHVCDMQAIGAIADSHNLFLIEDAAHAPGATLAGRKAGTFGDIACFSFFSNKNMTTGEGGMVVTNRDDLAEKVRLMRSHGMTTLTWDRHQGHAYSYDVVMLGYNYRIDEMRSALGLAQLAALEGRNKVRQHLVESYVAELESVKGISIPFKNMRPGSAHYIFPVLVEKASQRLPFINSLKQRGIQTSVHYPPIHLFDYYRKRFKYAENDLPITENLSAREVTLPLYPTMGEAKLKYVCDEVKRAASDF
jgi:dTDP-4-amino-4,6-dideoxygalactose transaminase